MFTTTANIYVVVYIHHNGGYVPPVFLQCTISVPAPGIGPLTPKMAAEWRRWIWERDYPPSLTTVKSSALSLQLDAGGDCAWPNIPEGTGLLISAEQIKLNVVCSLPIVVLWGWCRFCSFIHYNY